MTIGAPKPPPFYGGNIAEHIRQIVDFITSKDSFMLEHLEHAMTSSEDDVNLTGYPVVRLDSDGAYNLTGIVAETGRMLTLINVSAFTITLKHLLTSVAENQLHLGTGDYSLVANSSIVLWYDDVTNKWRKVAT